MQDAVSVKTGAMAAILGLDLAQVERVCAEAAKGEVVGVANVNSAQQIVVAGHRAAVERAVALASHRGGTKSVMLPVSAPFHCALMAPAADKLARELGGGSVADPALPLVRNVDAGVTRTAAEGMPLLPKQVASPGRWADCGRRLAARGGATVCLGGAGRVRARA